MYIHFSVDSLWRDVLDIDPPCLCGRGGGVDDAEVGADTLAPHVVMVRCHQGHEDRAEDNEDTGAHCYDSDAITHQSSLSHGAIIWARRSEAAGFVRPGRDQCCDSLTRLSPQAVTTQEKVEDFLHNL